MKQLEGPTHAVATLGTPSILADSTAPKSLAGLPWSAFALTAVEWEPRKDVADLPWRRLALRWGIWVPLLTASVGFPAGEERLRAVPLESESDVSDVAALLLPRSKDPPVAAYAVPESATTSATMEIAVAGDGRCTLTPFSVRPEPDWPLEADHGAGWRPDRPDSTTGAAHLLPPAAQRRHTSRTESRLGFELFNVMGVASSAAQCHAASTQGRRH